MADTLPPLVLELRAKADQLESEIKKVKSDIKDMGDESEKSSSKVGGSFDSMGKAGSALKGIIGPVVALFAATQVLDFAKQTVTAASDLNEAGTAVTQIYGEATDKINKWAQNAATSMGQSNLEALNAAKTFGVYGQAAGLSADANADFSMTLAQTASDLASFHNADPSEVIAAIGSGLRGEAEPLRKFGILLDDATLKAQAMKMGIADGNAPLTQQQKVLAANAAILAQTGAAAGDFARTSGGLANQQRIFAASLENVKAAFGTAFLPFVNMGMQALNALMGPLMEVGNAFAEFGAKISAVFTTAGGGAEGFKAVFDNIGNSLMNFVSGGGLMQAFTALSNMRTMLFNKIMEALPGIIEGFVQFMPQIITFITGQLIPGLVNQFTNTVTIIADLLSTSVPLIVGAFAELLPQLVQSVADMLPPLVTSILGMIPGLLNAALTAFKSIVDAVITILPQIIQTISTLLPQLIQSIMGMLPSIIQSALSLFSGIVNGIVQAIPVIIGAVLELLPILLDNIMQMLPSLIMAAMDLFIGIVTGLVQAIPSIIKALVDMIPMLVTTLVKMIPQLITAGIQLLLGLVSGLIKAIPQLISAAIGAIPQVVSALIGAIPQLIDAGFQLLQGLIKGLVQDAPRLIGNAVKMLGNTVMNGIKGFFGIKSPSRLFMGVGEMLTAGLVKGLNDSKSLAGDAAMSLASAVSDNFNPSLVIPATNGAGYFGNSMPTPAIGTGGQIATPNTVGVTGASSTSQNVNVFVETNATPTQIASSVGWQLRLMGGV